MSDSPYNFLPPDDAIALARRTPRDLKNDALRALSGFAANVGGDPHLTEGMPYLPSIANYVPFTGLAENLGGMAGTAYEAFRTIANERIADTLGPKYKFSLPPQWEWTKAAASHIGRTEDDIDKSLGAQVDITDPGDVARSGFMHGVGSMVPAAPGSLLSGLGKAGTVAKWFLPTTENAAQNMGLTGLLGFAGGAYEAQKIQDEIAKSGLTREQVRDYLATEDQQQTEQPPAPTPQSSADTIPPRTQIAAAGDVHIPTLSELTGQAQAQPSTRVDTKTVPTLGQLTGATAQTGGVPSLADLTGGQKVAPTFQEGGGYTGMTEQDVLIIAGLGVAGLFGARFFHGVGADVTQAGRLARLRDPAFVAQVADYNNKQIAAGRPLHTTEGLPKPPNVPSNPIHSAVTDVTNATLDHTAKVRDYINLSGDPSGTELMNRRWANVNNDSMHQIQARQFVQTGWDDRIQFQMSHPPAQTMKRYMAMTPDDRFTFDETLIARDELRNRQNNMIDYGRPYPLDFPDKSIRELRAIEARGMGQPHIADLVKAHDVTNKEIPDMGVKYRHFTPAEAADMQSKRPEVVFHTEPSGRILRTFGLRQSEPYTGIRQSFTPPLVAQAQHIEQAFREFRVNEINRQLYHSVEEERRAGGPIRQSPHKTPNIPQYGILPEDIVNKAREPIVYIRDNGIKAIRVHDPMLYEAYTRQNVTRQRAALGAWAAVSRIFAHTTTGVASLATGRIFPVRPAVWTATTLGVNRPKGSVGGLIEKYAIPGYRGWDPTNYAGAAYAYGAGRIAARAGDISRILAKDSPNPINRWFRAAIGDLQTDALQGVFDKYYRSSFEFFKRTQGMGGQASMFRPELPAYAKGKGTEMRMVSAELVPQLFMANTWMGRARPPMIRLRSALEQAYANMSEASHDWFAMINRGRGKYAGIGGDEKLAFDTRRLTGDPGVGGGSRWVQGITSTIPYTNITAQGTARRVQAFVETPAATTLAYIMAVGTPALISLLTAMGRSDAIEYMENVLSTSQRVSDIILFRNGYPPEQHVKIPLAQEDSWAYGLVLESLAKVMNLAAIKHMPDSMAQWGEFLHDYLHEHITQSTVTSIEQGVQRGVGLDWPLLNAAMGITGKQFHFDIPRIIASIENGTFGTDTFLRGTGSAATTPNTPAGDGTLDGVDGKKLTDAISNTFGSVGAMVTMMFNNASRYYAQTGDFFQALGMAGHDWVQQAKDYNPQGNTFLWENSVRSSLNPAIVEYNKNRMAAIKQTQDMSSAMRNEGFTGGPKADQLPLPPNAPGAKTMSNQDPIMAQIMSEVHALNEHITRHLEPQATAIKKQMDDVNAKSIDPEGNRLTPEQKRDWLNKRTRDYADVYRTIGGFIDDTDAQLTSRYGHYIRVGKKIDWHGTLDQFPPVE